MKNMKLRPALKLAAGIGLGVTALPFAGTAFAQNEEIELEEIVITGSRITQPGVVSSSPIQSISAEEIGYLQEPEIEKILRILPATIPGDGGNVNNGTAGAATIDLRGLGPERNLVLLNGKRMTPFSFDGEVDTATIPTALVERVDVVTGGASAVYGSDAIAGAVNFILKRDFEGVELVTSRSETGDQDGRVNNVALTLGSNLADDRGNIAMSFSYFDREPILLGQRDLGLLGIATDDGSNYGEFLAGQGPVPSPAGCGGPGAVQAGGSTTAIPTRFAIIGAGAAASGQFREDGTIGDECSVFNFNPFNYYQTPMERYSATAIGYFEINEHAEVYGTVNFTDTTVVQQVAPSGTFGEQFTLPLSNPLIGASARQSMIDFATTALGNGLLSSDPNDPAANWTDTNGNGVVDADDSLEVQLRRRTVELGPRVESFDADQFQIAVGTRGDIIGEWDYDLSFQYGESNRTRVRGGYTNLTNIQNALDTSDGVTCNNGDSTCVPIDLFGGFGTITGEAAGYATAIALIQEKYQQRIGTISVNGPLDFIQSPWADGPLLLSFGYEKREEEGSQEPDECLKLAPSSCQGGAGGNLLPVAGSYKVDDFFLEGLMPVLADKPFANLLTVEFGARASDYDLFSGTEETWKLGFNWRPVDQLLVRVMKQQATRTPNIGELFSPVVTGLDNAVLDPCSVANPNIDARLRALCIGTGMSDAQVGQVQDIISGQVNTFDGSDPNSLPEAETADTRTAGIVWTPDLDMFTNFTLSLDYYDIDISGIIGEFSAQETLDGCYVAGRPDDCAKIQRVGGDLTLSAAGIQRFTTNKDFERAEGLELSFSLGVALGEFGELQFSGNVHQYLTQESQSSALTAVIDCKGFYGTSCDPVSELRWVQRTSWLWNNVTVSAQWRHIDAVDIEKPEAANTFANFQNIDDYDYIDLFASYNFQDKFEVRFGVDNVGDIDPPVVGNEAGDTSSNSGNTFPSNYDVLGRVYTLGFTASF